MKNEGGGEQKEEVGGNQLRREINRKGNEKKNSKRSEEEMNEKETWKDDFFDFSFFHESLSNDFFFQR